MKEQWKDIKGYESLYQVSNKGRVRSFKGSQPKILTPMTTVDGYKNVRLYKTEKEYETKYVHRIVLKHFIGEPPTEKHECNHKDGVKSNNNINNLEWVTKTENMRHAQDIGNLHKADYKEIKCTNCDKKIRKNKNKITPSDINFCSEDCRADYMKGEKQANSKLTEEEVKEIYKLANLPKSERPSYPEIGKEYGVSKGAVSGIKNENNWTHITENIELENEEL